MELTKDSPILQFDEVYALKLEEGLTAIITYDNGTFLMPEFDEDRKEWLKEAISAFGVPKISIYLTATLARWIVTDVKFNDDYLAVPFASNFAAALKFPFLRHKKIKTNSIRRIKKYSPVELRPLDEFVLENGERLIYRYDRKEKSNGN